MSEKQKSTPGPKVWYNIKQSGFVCIAVDLNDGSGDAVIQLNYGDKTLRQFTFPSYKVFNIAAHLDEIIESEFGGDSEGYATAASNGLGGFAPMIQVASDSPQMDSFRAALTETKQ